MVDFMMCTINCDQIAIYIYIYFFFVARKFVMDHDQMLVVHRVYLPLQQCAPEECPQKSSYLLAHHNCPSDVGTCQKRHGWDRCCFSLSKERLSTL